MREVPIGAQSIERFAPLWGEAPVRELLATAAKLKARLGDRVIWNINSTAAGGGVAELLRSLVAYVRGAGLNTRWDVLQGPPEFFRVTKRLHHALHGSLGDGSPLEGPARAVYDRVSRENASALGHLIHPGDVVLLHDPQTAGMILPLDQLGAKVIWRCHVGTEHRGEEVTRGWDFLLPYLGGARRVVFSRADYVPPAIDRQRLSIIPPTIDPFSAKNQPMDAETGNAILTYVGVVEGNVPQGHRAFLREDGSPGRVDRCAELLQLGPAPRLETPLVMQLSRWDGLKDPIGVMQGFARLVASGGVREAECLLVGPNPSRVADDPEGAEVFAQVVAAWRGLPEPLRRRIHLVNLPMDDVEENGAIVNALQRHAEVVVQKSLREGFGLTVAEAMWKERAVLASAVGGIQDQIEDGVSGLLLPDPCDLPGFGDRLRRLLDDAQLRKQLGARARERVRERFLGVHSLLRYAEVVAGVLD
jgi:trehalose synthase